MGFPLSGLVGWPADQAAEKPLTHDLLASWPYRRYLIGLWHVWLPPWCCGCQGAWQPVAPCGSLWPPVAACGNRLDAPKEEIGDIDAWRPEASMPGCNVGWLAGLAGLAGWLAWLVGLAGWLQLAGCCWLAAAG